jgi:hypothetical protein
MIGDSALALHYANIIIITEKLLQYLHLVGEEARNDLYQMLSSSLKASQNLCQEHCDVRRVPRTQLEGDTGKDAGVAGAYGA